MKDNNDYKVNFAGATISKKEASKVGLTLIIGIVCAVPICLIFGIKDKVAVFIICLILAAIGYFGIANRVFKQ